jgi:hypothetical protein
MQVLTYKAQIAIDNSLNARNRLAYEMKKHIDTVQRWINDNKPDGPLTTSTALQIIESETGLKETEILTEA